MLGTASAAAALAELHSISSDKERELDGVRDEATPRTYHSYR